MAHRTKVRGRRRQRSKSAVKKRSQLKTTFRASAWTKRSKATGESIAVKKPGAKKAAKKFKGVRREK